MSVLRKRTPWIITAGVMLSALALGLAGCGNGGGDEPFPPFNRAFSVPIVPSQAPQGQATVGSTGGTVNATVNPTNFGGVSGVTITFPAGSIGNTQAIGVAIVPPSQATINTVHGSNPGALNGQVMDWTNVAEVVVGPVLSNGTIDPNGLIGNFSATLQLTPAQSAAIQNLLGSNRQLGLLLVNNGTATLVNNGNITFNNVNFTINIGNINGGTFNVITLPTAHNQGGGG